MEKWKDLHVKVTQAEAINASIRHLIDVLEMDGFWVARHRSVELAKSQIKKLEIEFDEMKKLLAEFQKGHEDFRTVYDKLISEFYPNFFSKSEAEYVFYTMHKGIHLSLSGSIEMRDSLIVTINSFRKIQNLPPLDGGLSHLN